MESGKTYTENELGEKNLLEREIRFIFNKDFVSKALVTAGNKLIKRWKNLVEWKEDTTPVLKDDKT
jgi:hypothetical protein